LGLFGRRAARLFFTLSRGRNLKFEVLLYWLHYSTRTGQMQPPMTRLVTLAETIRAVRMGSPRRWPNTVMLNERLSGRVFAAVHRRQTVRLQVGPEWCLLNTAQFAHDTSCRPVTADERRALRFIVSWSSASI
jgi:hypothetical protein